jgi:hypothetical protein
MDNTNTSKFVPPNGFNPFVNTTTNAISPESIAEDIDRENETAHEEAKAAKIAEHMATCGQFFYRPDPSNGRRLVAYEVSCGYWRRGCKRCLSIRARDFEARFHRCIKDTNGVEYLGIAQMSKSQSAKLVKKMKRMGVDYWRIPMDEGILLIFDSLHFPDLNNPELHDIDTAGWIDLCQTPKGTRHSGNLGRKEEKEKTGITVKVPQFSIENMEPDNIDRAWSLALKNTDDLEPVYEVESIEDALQVRMDSFEDAIISMGGEIGEKYRVMTRVKEDKFGWRKVLSPLETIDPVDINKVPPGFVEETDVNDIDLIFDY